MKTKIILYIVLCLFTTLQLAGQVTNGDAIHIQVNGNSAQTKLSDNQREDPVYILGAREDTDQQSNSNINPAFGTNAIWKYNKDQGCDDGCIHYFNNEKIFSTPSGTTNHGLDFFSQTWEHESDAENIYNNNDKDRRIMHRYVADITTYPTNKESEYTINEVYLATIGGVDYYREVSKFRFKWKYAHGSKASPLTFGVLDANGSYTHRNNNSPKGSNYDSNLGYINDFTSDGSTGPDVSYTFTLNDAKAITIQNFGGVDAYGDIQSLYDENDLENPIAVGGTSFTTSISDIKLCPGTYRVVMGGRVLSGFLNRPDYGDMHLRIIVEDITIQNNTITYNDNGAGTNLCVGSVISPEEDNASPKTFTGGYASTFASQLTYQWQIKEGNNAYVDINGAVERDLQADADVIMPDATATIRRKAEECGIISYSNTVVLTPAASSTSPGHIDFADGTDMTTIPSGGSLSLVSETDGSSNEPTPNGSVTYMWEKSNNGGNNWNDINGATGDTYATLPLTESTWFRRTTINDCGTPALDETNVLKVNVLVPNGVISGRITSPQNGPNVSGVEGVTVTVVRRAVPAITGGTNANDTKSIVTGPDGTYTIDGLYYGEGPAIFDITPVRGNDQFVDMEPNGDPTRTVTLTTGSPEKSDQNFIDLAVYSFTGKVFQDISGGQCGMDTIQIKVNGQPIDSTNADGTYSLSLSGNNIIEPFLPGHTFVPPSIMMDVQSAQSNQNFENTTTHSISGFVSGGCNTALGSAGAQITFTTEDLCNPRIVNTASNGSYNVTLPARAYNVKVTNFDNPDPYGELEVLAYFQRSTKVDLLMKDTFQDFIFKPEPRIIVNGIPSQVCNQTVFEQLKSKDIQIEIFDGPSNCPLDTGFVLITDDISDRANQTIRIPVSNGVVDYTIVPGDPNVVSPYMKKLTIVASDTLGQSSTFTLDAIVTGSKARTATFTTVTPEIPLMILRDPPGDQSYSFIEQEKTLEVASSFYTLAGGSLNTWAQVEIGTEFEAGFLGFSTESDFSFLTAGGLTIGGDVTDTDETVWSVSTTERFETSAEEYVIGTEGDVFIGAALNLLYANSDNLSINPTTCQPELSVKLAIAPTGFETQYIYSEGHIRNKVIPDLEILAQFHPNPDSVAYFLDQASVWEQALTRNEQLKAMAEDHPAFPTNITLNGGGQLAQYSMTTTNSEIISYEFNVTLEEEIIVEAGLEVAGNGVFGGVTTKIRADFGKSKTTTNTSSFTSGFALKDNDLGDQWTIDIKNDPVYNTPVFDLVAADSSCPWEEGSKERSYPQITVVNPVLTGQIPATGATFELRLTNAPGPLSAETSVDLVLDWNGDSAPGASVELIGNGNFPDSHTITNNNGTWQTKTVFVKVTPGVPNIYTYEDIKFILYASDCDGGVDDNISDEVSVSAFFQAPCSDISLFTPDPGWVLNQASSKLDVHLKNYTKSDLQQVLIRYSLTGSGAWTDAAVLAPADLNNNNPLGSNLGDITEIDLINLPEGMYDIRAEVICGQGTVYSTRATGIIERTGPMIFGNPSPHNGDYDQTNDEVAIYYDEDITCSSATFVEFYNNNTDVAYNGTVQCVDNKAVITPSTTLPDGEYSVQICDVMDEYGNKSLCEIWFFVVGEYLEECGPLDVENNNNTFDAIVSDLYQGSTVRSDNVLEAPDGDVHMQGEISVTLDPGFEVPGNTLFLANIDECDPNIDDPLPCDNAIAISSGNHYQGDLIDGVNLGAAYRDPSCSNSSDLDNPGLWYTFTGTGEIVTLALCGPDVPVGIFIYEGDCRNLICEDNAGVYDITFTEFGVEYYVLVAPRYNVDHAAIVAGTTSGQYVLSMDAGSSICDDHIYVDVDATGLNTGSNWTDAYTSLQDAIATGASKIWVAEGIYRPDQGTGITVDDRNATFSIGNQEIYGGFAGNEPIDFDLDSRDIEAYETILSGDLGQALDPSDNSFHVVTRSTFDLQHRFDGVTISGGNANVGGFNVSDKNRGGGIYVAPNATAFFSKCNIRDNYAITGGGIRADAGSIVIAYHTIFLNNEASFTGGAVSSETTCEFSFNTFAGNKSSEGGSVYAFVDEVGYDLAVNDGTKINNSIIWGNDGGTFLSYASYPDVSGSFVQSQSSMSYGTDIRNEDPLFVTEIDRTGSQLSLTGNDVDLSLQATSPAINAVTDLLSASTLLFIDRNNNARPRGGAHDVGAYEYGVGPRCPDSDDTDNDGILDCEDYCVNTPDMSIDFDGADDYIEVAHDADLNVSSNNFTLEAWVFLTDLDQDNTIISKGHGSTGNTLYSFSVLSTGEVSLSLGNGSNTLESKTSVGKIPLTTWTHVAVTFDKPNKGVKFFINGVEDSPTQEYVIGTFDATDSDPMYIGRNGSQSDNNYFNGRLDDVTVWSEALNVTKIAITMSARLRGTEDDLVAFYNFNDSASPACTQGATITAAALGQVPGVLQGNLKNFSLGNSCFSNWAPGRNLDSDNGGKGDSCEDVPANF